MPRPADVQRMGENSPIVGFSQGKALMIMDIDAFEYTYGEADGPDPAQRDLDAMLENVTRVCVLEGAMLQGARWADGSWSTRSMPARFVIWRVA